MGDWAINLLVLNLQLQHYSREYTTSLRKVQGLFFL